MLRKRILRSELAKKMIEEGDVLLLGAESFWKDLMPGAMLISSDFNQVALRKPESSLTGS